MHNCVVGPFSVDKNIINAHMQKGPYIVALKYLHTYKRQLRSSLQISENVPVFLLWEILATVQNFMLSGKY